MLRTLAEYFKTTRQQIEKIQCWDTMLGYNVYSLVRKSEGEEIDEYCLSYLGHNLPQIKRAGAS